MNKSGLVLTIIGEHPGEASVRVQKLSEGLVGEDIFLLEDVSVNWEKRDGSFRAYLGIENFLKHIS